MHEFSRNPGLKKALDRRNPDYSRDPAGCFAKHAHRARRAARRSGTTNRQHAGTYWVGILGWRTD
ncbi:MAG: hypothetical protein Q8Q05_01370 [bacterium]|nr:hypothetical protein [bacterium]